MTITIKQLTKVFLETALPVKPFGYYCHKEDIENRMANCFKKLQSKGLLILGAPANPSRPPSDQLLNEFVEALQDSLNKNEVALFFSSEQLKQVAASLYNQDLCYYPVRHPWYQRALRDNALVANAPTLLSGLLSTERQL